MLKKILLASMILTLVATLVSACGDSDGSGDDNNPGNGDADTDSDGDSDSDSDSDGDSDSDSDSDADSDSDSDGDCDCTDDIEAPASSFEFKVVQNFASENDEITLSLGWEIGDGDAVGETFPFELEKLALCDDSSDFCISDKEQMDYEWGHHNWDETLTAERDGKQYEVRMVLDAITGGGWTDTLEIRSLSDGATILGPVALTDQGCRTVPPGNPNACIWRERLDE